MGGLLGLDREELLDSVVSVVPMTIIVLLTLLFVAYNPWGWQDELLIGIVLGLHLVPILTLAPVTYLVVKVLVEASDGRSETADRVTSWIVATGSSAGDEALPETPPSHDTSMEDDP